MDEVLLNSKSLAVINRDSAFPSKASAVVKEKVVNTSPIESGRSAKAGEPLKADDALPTVGALPPEKKPSTLASIPGSADRKLNVASAVAFNVTLPACATPENRRRKTIKAK